MCRNSFLELFCQKGILKNLSKFTGKHLYWSLFFKKSCRPSVAACLCSNVVEIQTTSELRFAFIHVYYRTETCNLQRSSSRVMYIGWLSDVSILWTHNCATPHVWKAEKWSPIYILQKQNFKGVLTYLAVLFNKNYWWKL